MFLLLMMAHGIIAVSIITALMPRMSAAAADGRYADVAADLSRGTCTVSAVLALIAVCYAVLATPLAVTLFRYGAFTDENAADTSLVLLLAALALVPFAISQLFTFAFYALPDTRTPALINIPVVALRIGVQVVLYVAFAAHFAAAGMMIGNAVSYLAAAFASAWLLRPRVGRIGMGAILRTRPGRRGRVGLRPGRPAGGEPAARRRHAELAAGGGSARDRQRGDRCDVPRSRHGAADRGDHRGGRHGPPPPRSLTAGIRAPKVVATRNVTTDHQAGDAPVDNSAIRRSATGSACG